MESIILSLGILGLILLMSLIGWLIDKISKTRSRKDNICVLTKDLAIENPHWILLYLFFLSVTQAGFQNILGSFNMTEDSVFESSLTLSFLLVSFTFYQVNKKRQLIKKFRSLIKLAAANDTKFLHRLSLSNPGNFLDTRDIPLSLILEKQGMTADFIDNSGQTTMHNFLERSFMGPRSENLELAKKELEELGTMGNINWTIVYEDLKILDSITSELLPDKIINKYPRDIYFLRLNFIEMALPWIIKEEPLILEKSAKGEEIIGEFCKLALNKFYMHPDHWKYRSKKEYTEQIVSFNINELEKYLQKTN